MTQTDKDRLWAGMIEEIATWPRGYDPESDQRPQGDDYSSFRGDHVAGGALRALAAKGIAWQPIATMPEDRKDGRQMLGFDASDPSPEWQEAFTMCWNADILPGWLLSPGGPVEAGASPTHWADINPPEPED